jgi:DNA-binding NarL/FixJ family response regulator
VLIDVSLPGMSGIELVERLIERHSGLRCLIVSGHREKQYAQQSLAVGAHGYIVKRSVIDELTAGIRQVMRGETYLSRSLRHL